MKDKETESGRATDITRDLDSIYEVVLWRAGLLGEESPEERRSSFTDERHPLACYREPNVLDQDYLMDIARRLEMAYRRIQTDNDLDTRADLAAFLDVGKNEPREWANHPERVGTHKVARICELSGLTLEELRYGSSGTISEGDGLPRFTARELITFYDLLSDEQQAVITRMVYEMELANRMRSVYAGD
ncbi:MAG: hypothetical protein IKF78_01245 [Atopobiaceae bacterium]|nr:hypothetical protein [Atopobiaceae bacterium]